MIGAIERGHAESNNATNTTGESANVNNRFSRASTPSRKTVIDADNWEIMRRLLERGGGSNVQNNFYSETSRESELPHPRECGRGPNRESSANRLYDVYEAESSSSSESEGEIAASGSGAASLGPASRGGSSAYREHMTRPVSAVRAFRDWRISCSGASSASIAFSFITSTMRANKQQI